MTALPFEKPALTRAAGKPRSRSVRRAYEGSIKVSLIGCAVFSITTTALIIFVLGSETMRFFTGDFGDVDPTISEFVTGLEWNPLLGAEKHFGIWPLILGTLLVTGVAMLVAIPLGLITAVFLSEYAPRKLRAFLKPVLEVLAGVPTVVYGFFALTVITPILRMEFILTGSGEPFNPLNFETYNVMAAGLAVGIMCIPIVTSISEDSLQAVPRALREGAYGLGGTRFDVSMRVVVPAGLSGIIAASLLAVARGVGETMIVALAAGNLARLLKPEGRGLFEWAGDSFAVNDSAQTMTAYMVQIFLGDASNFGPEYFSSYAVAATLFILTLGLTLLGHYIRVKFREAYD